MSPLLSSVPKNSRLRSRANFMKTVARTIAKRRLRFSRLRSRPNFMKMVARTIAKRRLRFSRLRSRYAAAALLSMFTFAAIAGADPVFTNLVLGQNYNTAAANPITGNGITNGRKGIVLAVEFTPTSSFTFSDARLALGLKSGTNSIDVYLESSCGNLPCQTIEELVLNNALKVGSSSVVTADSTASSVLNARTPYWLVLTAGAPDTIAYWFQNLGNDFATSTDLVVGFSGGVQGPWVPYNVNQLRPAFEIDGNPLSGPGPAQVPEPSSLLLFTVGALALISVLKCARVPDH